MKKLVLDVGSLEVQSFKTADAQPSRGTVVGAAAFLTSPANCITRGCGDSEVRACLEG